MYHESLLQQFWRIKHWYRPIAGLMSDVTEECLFGAADLEELFTPGPLRTSEAVFTVTLKVDGEAHEITVTRNTYLRDVQEQICRSFKKQWPATMAVIVFDQDRYDEFAQKPFMASSGGDVIMVEFMATDDPHPY